MPETLRNGDVLSISYYSEMHSLHERPDRSGSLVGLGIIPIPEVVDYVPEVSNVSPSPGSTITINQPFQFDVTDPSGELRRVIVAVRYPDGSTELLHDGTAFTGFYSGLSSRVAIAYGYRFTVRRTAGWPASPTFEVFAFDKTGNEA